MRNVLIGMLAALVLPFLAFAEQWTDSRGVTWSYYVRDLFGDISEYAVSHPGGVSISGASGAESVEGVLVFPDEIDGHEVVEIRNISLYCTNVTVVVWPARLKLMDGLSLRLSDDAVALSFPSSLRSLSGFFKGAHIQELNLPEGLVVLDATFRCPELTSVKLPESLRIIKQKDDAFSQTGVQGTKIGAFTLVDGWAIAWDKSDLPDVVVPKECRGIASGLFSGHHENGTITFQEGFQYVSPHAFAQSNGKNGGWTEIVFPSALKAIGHNAFYGATHLTRLVIPAGDLGDDLFGSTTEYNYQRLTALELGEGVTSIGEGAFRRVQEWPCYLPPIVLPNSVTNIHTTSFGGRCCSDGWLQFKSDNTHFCRETENGITTVYRLEDGVKVELISLQG